MTEPSSPYAAPMAETAPGASSIEPVKLDPSMRANMGLRILARLIDIATVYLTALIGWWLGILFAPNSAWARGSASRGESLLRLVFWVGLIVYAAVTEWRAGATLGKWICRLRVLSNRGLPPGLIGTLLRSLMFAIDMPLLLLSWSAIEASTFGERSGDRIGGTVVVSTAGLPTDYQVNAGAAALSALIGLVPTLLLPPLIMLAVAS